MMSSFVVPYHLDERVALRVPGAFEITTPDQGDVLDTMVALYGRVAEAVRAAVARGDRPVVASGDCTTSLGVLAGTQRAGLSCGVVWFDAHGDFNTPETTPSGYVGGMPLAEATGRCDLGIRAALRSRATQEHRVVLVDGRDLDPGEAELLSSSDVGLAAVEELEDRIPPGPLYLHIDVDVVDPGWWPALRYPAAGGPSLDVVRDAIAQVLATDRVVAIGLACTWDPARLDHELAASLLERLGTDRF